MPGVFALSGCQGSSEVRREHDAAVGRRVLCAWREREIQDSVFLTTSKATCIYMYHTS